MIVIQLNQGHGCLFVGKRMGSYRRAARWHQGPSTAEIAKAVALNDAFVDGLERLKDMAIIARGEMFPPIITEIIGLFCLVHFLPTSQFHSLTMTERFPLVARNQDQNGLGNQPYLAAVCRSMPSALATA
jgi:hypothetical protein